jgi:uncharacterized alpha-E superfamily protein
MGRRLERSQQLATLLRAVAGERHDPALEAVLLEAALASTESAMAYRRGYHDEPQCEPVLTLLLFDASNPRALAFQLEQLRAHIDLLPREESAGASSQQTRQIKDLLERLRRADPAALALGGEGGRRTGLETLLLACDGLLRDLAIGLAHDYFSDRAGPQQLVGG